MEDGRHVSTADSPTGPDVDHASGQRRPGREEDLDRLRRRCRPAPAVGIAVGLCDELEVAGRDPEAEAAIGQTASPRRRAVRSGLHARPNPRPLDWTAADVLHRAGDLHTARLQGDIDAGARLARRQPHGGELLGVAIPARDETRRAGDDGVAARQEAAQPETSVGPGRRAGRLAKMTASDVVVGVVEGRGREGRPANLGGRDWLSRHVAHGPLDRGGSGRGSVDERALAISPGLAGRRLR